MYFQAQSEGYLIDIIDNDWRLDTLPNDDIAIPLDKIPDLETDTDQTSLKEQVSDPQKNIQEPSLNLNQ